MKNRRGFTLVELMIVVAIIGILAAIAIPNFLSFRMKAKTSEAKSNLGAIRGTEIAYFAEWECYVGGTPLNPNSRNGADAADKLAWVTSTRFSLLGFAPEGKVFFSYSLAGPPTGDAVVGFTASAVSDLDMANGRSRYTISTAADIGHSGDEF